MVVVLVGGAITFQLQQPSQPAPSAAPTTPAAPPTPPRPPPPKPVEEAALEGLLLNINQVNAAMGTTEMTINETDSAMLDSSGMFPDKACVYLWTPIQQEAYVDSGWNALRGQALADSKRDWNVGQNVVLFTSADAARAFFNASAQRWPACSNRQFLAGPPDHTGWISAGPVSNSGGTLGATRTLRADNYTCQRTLTVANNVAIDVIACSSSNLSPDAAVHIARQIAAKVPTT